MFAVVALLSALCYGAADFLGGFTAKRASTLAIVVLSQLAGLLLLLVAVPFLPPAAPGRADVVWGALAGVAGGGGVALLYRGQSGGVAPGRHGDADERRKKSFALAVLSGVAIGLFFVALARTGREAGLWPLVAARSASVILFAVIAFFSSQSLRIPAAILAIVVAGGALDMLANLLYLLASRAGPLSVVVTLASLYPASTVLLARLVLHERLSARQWIGVACALVAVTVIVQ